MKGNCIKVLSLFFMLGNFWSFAQEEQDAQEAKYYGKERKYVDFTSDKVRFNSWSVGIYGGIPIMHSADFRSFTKDKKGIGYDAQLSLSKEITHAFALQLLGQYGKTKQYSRPNEGGLNNGLYWEANTQYWGVSLLGDLNLTSLFRRGR